MLEGLGTEDVQNGGKPMTRKGKQVEAVARIRISSATNVGADKRQRAVIGWGT